MAALAVASGGALLGAGCGGTSPVPTSTDVDRDPLAALDDADWDARSPEELRALPVQGSAQDLSTWADLGEEDGVLDTARDAVLDFVTAAYLTPEELHGLDDEDALDRISSASPEFWHDGLRTVWDEGNRLFYALALAEPFRTVGRPAICADWHRSEIEDVPILALGTTIAWTVIHTETRAVGVLAYRLGLMVDLEDDGTPSDGDIRVTVHGLDGCASSEQDGLAVPALEDDERHRSVQRATHDQVLASPRVPLRDVRNEDSPLFAGDEDTYLYCD